MSAIRDLSIYIIDGSPVVSVGGGLFTMLNMHLFESNEKDVLHWISPMIHMGDHASPYKLTKVRVQYSIYLDEDIVKHDNVLLSEEVSGDGYIDYSEAWDSVPSSKYRLSDISIETSNSIRNVSAHIRRLLPR